MIGNHPARMAANHPNWSRFQQAIDVPGADLLVTTRLRSVADNAITQSSHYEVRN